MNIDKTVLLKACTEMVTVNGRPFTIFHDSGFRRILDPLSEAIGQGNIFIYVLIKCLSVLNKLLKIQL